MCAIFATTDLLAERIAEMDRAAQVRAERVRSRLAFVARLMRQKGAQRIWVFGSMASGGHPHGDSDVDLVVEGLPAAGLIRTNDSQPTVPAPRALRAV